MTRAEILEAAKACVCGDREKGYGKPEDNFAQIASLWTVYYSAKYGSIVQPYTPEDVALMMALLKIARAMNGNNTDNFVDLAGYAACAGEVKAD